MKCQIGGRALAAAPYQRVLVEELHDQP